METGEVTSAGAVVNRGLRLVPMHEAQWMRYAEDTLVIPRVEAKERWDDQLANTAEEAKDNLGPRASPLRIPMPFQDYIDASNFSSQQNEIRRCSKRMKASDDNMFNAKEDLKEGVSGFGSETFEKVGGGVVATAGRMGTTATVNKRGEGSLGGVARPQSSIPVEKEAIDVKPEQQKKVKDLELVKEDVSIKLKQYIAERLKAIKKEVDVSKKACREATLASNGRIDGEGKVPYQSEFVDIMNKRLACLQHLTPEGGASSVTPKHADHELLKSCITDLMAIVAATDKDAETKGQELYKRAHAVNLTDAQNAAAFSGILAHFQVGSEALRVEQDLIDSISKFNGALNIEAGVREIIADRKSKKEPLPTTVLDRTRSLDFIELMGLQIASLTSEHAAKEFKNSIAQEEKRWKELTNAVQKGAKQVSDNIISYERKTANAKTQAASKEQKQKEREAAKRAREEAKQAQDAVKKAVASTHTDNFLLTGSHARLITIKKHEKNDVMGQSANYDFDKSVPYMINDPACMKSLVEQRTVKAAIGLFRIQYPTCNDAKKFGFAYSPCAIDAKDKVRECLLALGPKTTCATRFFQAVSLQTMCLSQ